MLSLIAAIGKNHELGKENQLLWSLPDDLQSFRTYTDEHPIIMGRKTFESIGRPLSNRKNIVITRNIDFQPFGVDVTSSLEAGISLGRNLEHFPIIIGGAQIYRQSIPLVNHMKITHVDGEFPDADTFFPDIDPKQWKEVSRIHHQKDKDHKYAFDIVDYVKKENSL